MGLRYSLKDLASPSKSEKQVASSSPSQQTESGVVKLLNAILNLLSRKFEKVNSGESINRYKLAIVEPSSDPIPFLEFVAPLSGRVLIEKYGVFTDGLLGDNFEFIPMVDGKRVLNNHGTPDKEGVPRINLSLGPDLTDNSLVDCMIVLKPRQVLTWYVVNRSEVPTPMGIRFTGSINASENAESFTRGG